MGKKCILAQVVTFFPKNSVIRKSKFYQVDILMGFNFILPLPSFFQFIFVVNERQKIKAMNDL